MIEEGKRKHTNHKCISRT